MRAFPALVFAILCFATICAARPLEIYFIDVEGGQATLIVSPSGQSLLIDAGFTNHSGRDADRIADAAKSAHIKKIDFVLITHHHADHEGGVPNLIERFGEVGTFYDPGPPVDPETAQQRTYKAYEDAMAKQTREVVKPGDTIPIKGLQVTVVAAGGQVIDKPGEPNRFCAGIAPEKSDQPENARSVAVIVELDHFRFANLSDLTWNRQLALLCPENRVGKVDVLETPQHGADEPKAIYGLAPRVVILNNSARGNDPAGWKTLRASPGLLDLWQLHFSIEGAQDANSPDPIVANTDEPDAANFIKLSAEPDGSFTVFNARNRYSKTYRGK